jgi:hypothetical protein
MPARHRHHDSSEQRKSFTITPESCSRSAGICVHDALETVTTNDRNMHERTTRRLAPTDAGVRLAEHARRVLGDYEDSVQDVTGMAGAPSGVLRVTAPLLFGRRHVAPLIAQFLDQYPQMRAE